MSELIVPDESAIVMLVGAIKYWWDDNWGTPLHNNYVAWRDAANNRLVAENFLVYRPHEAFKGRWDERGQSVNDMALKTADVIVNLTPPGIPSLGTDGEILFAANNGSALFVNAPPPPDFEVGLDDMIQRIRNLNIHRKIVPQEVVLESLPLHPGREWMLRSAAKEFSGNVLRLHYFDDGHRIQADDSHKIVIPKQADLAKVHLLSGPAVRVAIKDILKLEVLERKVA